VISNQTLYFTYRARDGSKVPARQLQQEETSSSRAEIDEESKNLTFREAVPWDDSLIDMTLRLNNTSYIKNMIARGNSSALRCAYSSEPVFSRFGTKQCETLIMKEVAPSTDAM